MNFSTDVKESGVSLSRLSGGLFSKGAKGLSAGESDGSARVRLSGALPGRRRLGQAASPSRRRVPFNARGGRDEVDSNVLGERCSVRARRVGLAFSSSADSTGKPQQSVAAGRIRAGGRAVSFVIEAG